MNDSGVPAMSLVIDTLAQDFLMKSWQILLGLPLGFRYDPLGIPWHSRRIPARFPWDSLGLLSGVLEDKPRMPQGPYPQTSSL